MSHPPGCLPSFLHILLILGLNHVISIFASQETEIPLQIPALGREASIGELYNENTRSFLKSSIFKQPDTPTTQNMIRTKKLETFESSFHLVSSLKEKIDLLNLDHLSALSMLSGQSVPQGSFKYFVDTQTNSPPSEAVEGLLKFSIRKLRLTLDLMTDSMTTWISARTLKKTKATHFVVSIDYGLDTFVQLVNQIDDKEIVQSQFLHLNQLLNAILHDEGDGIDIPATNYTCHIYGDISRGPIFPQTIPQVFDYLNGISLLLTPTYNGLPKSYVLMSIDDLKNKMADGPTTSSNGLSNNPAKFVTSQTQEELAIVTTEILDIFQNASILKQDLTNLLHQAQQSSRNYRCLAPSKLIELEGTSKSFENSFSKFKRQIKYVLSSTQIPDYPPALQNLVKNYTSARHSLAGVTTFLKKMSDAVKFKSRLCFIFLNLVVQKNISLYLPNWEKDWANSVPLLMTSDHPVLHVLFFKQEWIQNPGMSDQWNLNLNTFINRLQLDEQGQGQSSRVIVDCELLLISEVGSPCDNVSGPIIYEYQWGNLTSTDMVSTLKIFRKDQSDKVTQLKERIDLIETTLSDSLTQLTVSVSENERAMDNLEKHNESEMRKLRNTNNALQSTFNSRMNRLQSGFNTNLTRVAEQINSTHLTMIETQLEVRNLTDVVQKDVAVQIKDVQRMLDANEKKIDVNDLRSSRKMSELESTLSSVSRKQGQREIEVNRKLEGVDKKIEKGLKDSLASAQKYAGLKTISADHLKYLMDQPEATIIFQGHVYDYRSSSASATNGCQTLRGLGGNVRSINSHGKCVRIFEFPDCCGHSIAIYPGSSQNPDTIGNTFASIGSIGPCVSNELDNAFEKWIPSHVYQNFPSSRTAIKLRDAPQGLFPVPDSFHLCHSPLNFQVYNLTTRANFTPDEFSVIRQYELGEGGRLIFVNARFRASSLSSEHVCGGWAEGVMTSRIRGDNIGLAVSCDYGGPTNAAYNQFMQSEENRKEWYERQKTIKDFLDTTPHGWVQLSMNFDYSDNGMRPAGFGYMFNFYNQNMTYGYLNNEALPPS